MEISRTYRLRKYGIRLFSAKLFDFLTMAILKLLFSAFFLFLLSVNVKAQTDRFYGSAQLSSTMISASSVAQDSKGFVWIGTEYGLNRYDGYSFVTFLNNSNDSSSVGYNLISTLFCENDGSIWIGTAKGLDKFDAENNRFRHLNFPGGITPRVTKILRLKRGELLAGTAGYGLFSVDENTLSLKKITGFTDNGDDEFYSGLFEDSNGNLWKCDAENGFCFNMLYAKTCAKKFVSDLGTPVAFAERGGEVLILCLHGMLGYKNGKLRHIPLTFPKDCKNLVFRSLHQDKNGKIYLGTRGGGLFFLPNDSYEVLRIESHNPNIDLNTSKVWSVFDDRDGNLWVGCQQKGILMIPGKKTLFESWSFSYQKFSVGTPVTAVCQGDNGIFWTAVQGNGIYGFDTLGNICAVPEAPEAVETIFRDSKGRFWIGTDTRLFEYDPQTGKSQVTASFDCDKINDIAEDKNGNLYISTFSRGFAVYDTKNKTLKKYSSSDSENKNGKLHNNWIHKILPDKNGLIWLATAAGVQCYNPENEYFDSCILDGVMCYSICKLSSGEMLVGTQHGLYSLEPSEKQVVKISFPSHTGDRAVYYIVQTGSGEIWCSTQNGIWRYKNRQWTGFINGNGLINSEYVSGLGMKDKNGKIYFGTSDGITCFQPGDFENVMQKTDSVYLTSLKISGAEQPLQGRKHFVIPYQTNSFTMEFSLFDYINSENTVFYYSVNNAPWTALNVGQNIVSFNNLASGNYKIQVKAFCCGEYSPVSAFYIEITTPWYRTFWAYFCYFLLAVSIIIYLIYNYLREKRRQFDDEKMKFLINAAHDIRSPLTLIFSPLKKLQQRHTEPKDREELSLIEHNAQRISGLVNQILDIRKIDKQQLKLKCQSTDIVSFIGGIFKMYAYIAAERNINYIFNCQNKKITAWIDRTQFDKVVGNLLSNAFKFTPDGGKIEAGLQEGENDIVFTVSDNGSGINNDEKERIFDRFYQSENSKGGTGIGLNLCKMIVEMHHGKISAHQGENSQGAVFSVRLLKGSSHFKPEELMPEPSKTQTVTLPNTQYRILFVDDDFQLCDFVEKELANYYHTECCHNGREAMRILNSKDFDLVISDVMMPEMDGFSLLRTIKRNPALNHIPVIVLSSKSDVANRLEGLNGGADAFIAKPFDLDELHALINNLINNVLRLKGKFSGAQQQKERVVKKEVSDPDSDLMDRIMSVINRRLDDSSLDVETLATEVGVGKTQLYKKMKEITGLNVAEFIRNIRLEQAARLLKEQKLNISQVAYTVGFSNPAHFSTLFKKYFGLTPKEYAA